MRVEAGFSSSSIVPGALELAVAPLLTGAGSFTGQSGAVVVNSGDSLVESIVTITPNTKDATVPKWVRRYSGNH